MSAAVVWALVAATLILAGALLAIGSGVVAVTKKREKDGDLIATAGVGILLVAGGVAAGIVAVCLSLLT
jgi:hypothetical protein